MIKKDIALIKKIVSRANDNSIIKCVTCYVDTKTDDIIFQKPKNFTLWKRASCPSIVTL